MEFHTYYTSPEILKRKDVEGSLKGISEEVLFQRLLYKASKGSSGNENEIARNQFMTEFCWAKDKKPYYKVWPGIIPHLLNIKLDKVKTDNIDLPEKSLLFRFSESEHTFPFFWAGKEYYLKTILAIRSYGTIEGSDELTVWVDFGEELVDELGPVLVFRRISLTPGLTMEEALGEIPGRDPSYFRGVQVPADFFEKISRVLVACCLLSTDLVDQLIVPDVLSKDRIRYLETGNPALFEKAKRRGKFGYDVGRELHESPPHWRAGCELALYWTGPGRKIPKYRSRKGCFVHRKEIVTVPTGRLSEEIGEDKDGTQDA